MNPEKKGVKSVEEVYLVAQQIFVMFIIAAIGYIATRFGVINEAVRRSLTDILLLIVTPAMFLDCMQAPFDAAMLHDFFLSVGLGFLAFLLTILAARYLLFGGKWTIEKAIDRCCVVYSNAGFIGIPLVAAGWGDKGIMLATGYILAFNIVSWTHGITEIGRGKGHGMITLKQLATTPIYWAIALGVPMYVFSIRLPAPLASACAYLGDLNTGLAMLVLGAFLATTGLRHLFDSARVYLLSALRLVVFPAVLLVIYWLLGLQRFASDVDVMLIHAAQMSAPTAFMVAMFAERVGEDPDFATKVITVSSLLSIVTVPGIIWFGKVLFTL